MGTLRITRLGHGGILYRSPADKWLWVDRWSGAPTYAQAYREAEQVDVVAPTHGHFDHVGNDAADVVELAESGATVVGSHELQIYLASLGVLLTAVYIYGLIFRPKRQFFDLGIDSIVVLVLYIVGIVGLFTIAGGK